MCIYKYFGRYAIKTGGFFGVELLHSFVYLSLSNIAKGEEWGFGVFCNILDTLVRFVIVYGAFVKVADVSKSFASGIFKSDPMLLAMFVKKEFIDSTTSLGSVSNSLPSIIIRF